jgi:hypothetical protein
MSDYKYDGEFLFDAAFDRFRELYTKGRNQGLTEIERVEIGSLSYEISCNLKDEGGIYE